MCNCCLCSSCCHYILYSTRMPALATVPFSNDSAGRLPAMQTCAGCCCFERTVEASAPLLQDNYTSDAAQCFINLVTCWIL